ncbi:hypothetical protein OC25_15230 [Pedobacter kyungheensis]|uniref:Uncharacterized protein n=1 Tax=Pedobacter kyungheensis TaxID=1069985 RepID=A0A0C1D6L1_9SPHI|nr:hypothetical protein OC25_15230 [Pedobacter kyungheensis]
MMKIKKAYYYLFYKFYKFGEWSPSVFPSDLTATLAIIFLELSTWASFKIYYKFFHRGYYVDFFSFQELIPLICIILINYFAFVHDQTWKKYFKKFEGLSKEQNSKGTFRVALIIFILLINFSFSLYVIGRINGFY